MKLFVRVMEIGEAAALAEPLPAALEAYAAAPRDPATLRERRAGLLLAARLYREVAGRPLPPLAFGERGKPTPTEGTLSFNISHAHRLVAVAVGEGELGIDLEPYLTATPERAARLSRRLSEGEAALLAAAPDKERAVLEAYVRKEAQAKRDGRGLSVLYEMDSTLPPRYEARPRDAEGEEYYLAVY
ncbi:MAG: hypothetical protein IJF73_05485 [Clostridia bacterium]|nr:hypothetical protein [Clostridia bacterium]